ncbi:MAG: DUF2225 domain-containing protein [candidate division Zixibacteria bacterium]|nr:DUF2225 domain-containing protein [candidate division Zixibacteria bacterium]
MGNDNPFFLSKIECPVCKTVNEFETVRVGAYIEGGRDTDFCPLDIQWRHARYQAYNPLAFFAAMCSNCYYTRELTNNFKEWKKDGNFRTYRLKTIKGKHLEKLATADSVIRKMGDAIDISRFPNESAILKLHLAIFDELLCDHPTKLDLGRLYLRVGWVFRGMEQGENPHQKFLQGLMLEVGNRHEILTETFEKLREETQVFSRHVSSHFESEKIPTNTQSQMFPFREKFENGLKSLEDSLGQTRTKLETIGGLVSEYMTAMLGGDGSCGGIAFGQHNSFVEFLLDLKNTWSDVAVNEREALERAVRYYREAYVEGRDISSGNQQIQASYLIAELSRRMGDYDGARQYFNITIKHGQEFIYQNRNDRSRTALARKILELAMEQGRENMKALKSA